MAYNYQNRLKIYSDNQQTGGCKQDAQEEKPPVHCLTHHIQRLLGFLELHVTLVHQPFDVTLCWEGLGGVNDDVRGQRSEVRY